MSLLFVLAQTVTLPNAEECPGGFCLQERASFNPAAYSMLELDRGQVRIP